MSQNKNGTANGDDVGEQPSIENQIKKMFGEEEVNPEEYENLIIDDIILKDGFKEEDQTYLNKFVKLQKLSLNSVLLKSLNNLPTVELKKLEISDNQVKGDELKKIAGLYGKSLVSLKACNNKIGDLDQVLSFVKSMPKLIKLDLTNNEVCDVDGYKSKVFEANAEIQVVDQKNKAGEEVFDSSDEEDYGEEGELDLNDMLVSQEILEKLDPETREKFKKGELSLEEMRGLGLLDDMGEEGEFEMYGEEGEEEDNEEGDKKQKK